MDDGYIEKKDIRLIIRIAVVTSIVAIIILAFADLNGGSLDPTDREVRVIITDSMEGEPTDYPISTIEKDSLVMVRHLDDAQKYSLKVGDVVQIDDHGILNHHRVISNDPDKRQIVTKGDNSSAKEYMSYDDVLGIVVGKNHLLGQVFVFVKANIVPIILIIAILFGVAEAIRYVINKGPEGE